MLSSWTPLHRSLLTRVQVVRAVTLDLRARCALAAAARGHDPAALVAYARKTARQLRGEKAAWCEGLATLLEAGCAWVSGDRDRAPELLSRAAEQLDACDMGMHAAAARRRRGEIVGGDEGRTLVAASDAWMARRRIASPRRLSAMLTPAFPD